MMNSVFAKKPRAVCVPFPAQGNINPMMQLAKLLHSRGFHITFVNTEFNHRRLIRSEGPEFAKGLPDFSFESIPDGLPPSDRDAMQDVPSEVPPVTCIISDGIMSFGIKAAEDLGIPQFQFWTSSACNFMGCLQYYGLAKRGIIPFKVPTYKTSFVVIIV
ncbi:hypothetical protein TIFTF001_004365 [Ficus carica]|uniref:Glycosyltransferase N-terminal domain-containing protein n=1 Tax=Ficus carica TaxID=3494 RepID=A0AA88A4A3_FICCA|nr:hypothetical protein TIFTF001_004365 [Ficus carica]